MARGGPDFGAINPRELTAPALDPGELAVRLGSPVVWDRRGFVLRMITGATPLQALRVSEVGSAESHIQARPTPLGPYCWRFTTTGPGDSIEVQELVPYTGAAGSGYELMFRPRDPGVTIQTDLLLRDGAAGARGGLRLDGSGGSGVEFLDSSATWTATPTQPAVYPVSGGWHVFKWAMDTSTYLYAELDGLDLGIAAEAVDDQGATSERSIQVGLDFTGSGFVTGETLVAGMILTTNEV